MLLARAGHVREVLCLQLSNNNLRNFMYEYEVIIRKTSRVSWCLCKYKWTLAHTSQTTQAENLAVTRE